MKNKTKIDNTKYRVLLSEILPFEVPIYFSNAGFYKNMISGRGGQVLNMLKKSASWTIPYDYKVRRNGGLKSRKLSIIHPRLQLEIVDFYNDNYDMMLYLCGNSPFSMRYISEVAKLSFDNQNALIIDKPIEQECERDDEGINNSEGKSNAYYSSYFTYKRIDRIYKFYAEMDLLRLEQKYECMRSIDIAGFFYHIYTHSITWAIKGKEVAKKEIGRNTFGALFDQLMQHCNYNETNGIVVGPEISRIFAEIIAQRVDLNVFESLQKRGIIMGKDYEVRRYVDDTMIFAHNIMTLDAVYKSFIECLEEYKLFLNEKKTETYIRPFTTYITIAKDGVKEVFDKFVAEESSIQSPYNYAKRFLYDIRIVVGKTQVPYESVNRYLLSLLASNERKLNAKDDNVVNRIITYLDIAYYVFSLDMSVSASIHMCRIMKLSFDVASSLSPTEKQIVLEKISKETIRCLKIMDNRDSLDDSRIELFNLLLVAKALNLPVISVEMLRRFFFRNSGKEPVQLRYFDICTLLALISHNDVDYKDIRSIVLESIYDVFINNSDSWKNSAELFMLFFDLLQCPHLSEAEKNNIIMKAENIVGEDNLNRRRHLLSLKTGSIWFFDWGMNDKLDYYLSKKTYNPIY